ncbi:hypothetical protein [Burkholderia guangdongensis]|nr:hypothetical protein [Burkholderia guangdongensis]
MEISIAVGLVVLTFALAFMVAHYCREHRRSRLTRQLRCAIWYRRGRWH